MPFAGFTDADFEAYAPQKWKSNVFNRERLEVKQKLVALARDIGIGLTAADGSPLTIEASVEHPALWNHKQVEAQHVYFSRNEGARKELDAIIDRQKSIASLIDDPTPQRNHLFLVVTLTHDKSEVALKLHPDARVDRQNLERRIADHFEREKLLRMLNRLPEPFLVGVTGGASEPAHSVDEARLQELVAQFGAPAPRLALPGAPQSLFYIGRIIARGEAVGAGPGFSDLARQSLAALLPIYQFIAWSRDNDFVSMREQLQKEKQTRRQRGLAKGDEVRIVRGVFSGKTGQVQEVDVKGGLRVLIGKVAVKLDAEDVVAVKK